MTRTILDPPHIVRIDNAVGSTDGWVMYPNFGRNGEWRYEEIDLSSGSAGTLESSSRTNRSLMIYLEFGVSGTVFLIDSRWKWECPFDLETITIDRRKVIVDRLIVAWKFNKYHVDSTELEISAGLRKRDCPSYQVQFVASDAIEYSEGPFRLVVRINISKDVIEIQLADMTHWSSPEKSEMISVNQQSHIAQRLAEFASSHGKSLEIVKN